MLIFEILLAIESEEERTLVERIYLEYYGRMLQICRQILKHPQDSEDAAMNAMKRIAENSQKFLEKDRNEIVSLVVIYTRNAALTYYNQRKRRYTLSTTIESSESSETEQMDIPDESQDIQRIVINCETIHMIEDALEQLTDEQKDAILLKYYYGYRYSEIAQVLCVEENVVRARIFRAKKRLKELLGDDAYERMYF
jgi:RNA polymerase sigma-70 factor (ECF subfamily)